MSKRLLLLALLAGAALILAGCGEPALTAEVDHGEAAAGEHAEGEAVTEEAPAEGQAPAEDEVPAEEPVAEATAEPSPTEDSHSHGDAGETTASTDATPVPGDPARGQELFETLVAEAGFACATCHRVDSTEQLIGPGLLNVSVHGATHVEGLDAYEYIYQSITEPGAYVVTGFPDNLMPRIYADYYSAQDIQDIMAYLFTLKE